ncbi:bifunctional DNA primase/polymerase [Nonomuraea sp. NPDC050643]|uniref:bifunctional DNA primase/polymerase n=1 Tax=Nonomuraea sp. NPDC050643 TaxID=3155660 RepID=UPI0033DD6C3C
MTLASKSAQAHRLDHALAAARRGWHVFPLRPGDKRPLKGFTDWEHHATTDPEVIRRCWSRAPYNIGIACGPSHLVVLDLDTPKDGKRPPEPYDVPGVNDGADVLALLCEQHDQPLPLETFSVRTRRNGLHLYFTASEGPPLANTSGRLGWLIDTRACGGYVVGPGSHVTLPDGTGGYDVLHAPEPAPLPAWLAVLLAPTVPAAAPTTLTAADVLTATGGSRAAGYAHAALRNELERVFAAAPGTRNATLNQAAFALGQLVAGGLLPRHLAETALHTAGHAIGLSVTETFATTRSGLDAGEHRPRRSAA